MEPRASTTRDVYLDHASTSFPKPEAVVRAVDRFLRECGGSPGRASHRKAREAERVLVETRQDLAGFLGANDPSRVVYTSNSTEALNLAIQGVLGRGDHVVITDLEHNAVVRPLWRLREERGIRVTVVESDLEGFVDPARIEAAIGVHTRLVCCVHASNVLGTIQPIADIGRLAWRRGALFLVDASQSAGVLPLDVEETSLDFLAFTGHKGLLGPPGTGGLYVREGVRVRPLKHGGTGSRSEDLDPPAQLPEAYEVGTCNAPGLAGLRAGVAFVRDQGPEAILAHEREMNGRFLERIAELPSVRTYGPSDPGRKTGITLLSIEGLAAADVGRMLDRRFGVMVRAGLHCAALTHRKLGTEREGAVRFSFGYSTTTADVDSAADALARISAAMIGA